MPDILQWLTMAVRELVDHPDDVDVSSRDDLHATVITVRVNPADAGQAIGRRGATAKAFRVLVSAAGGKLGRRLALHVDAPREGGGR